MGLKAAWRALFGRSEAAPVPTLTGAEPPPVVPYPTLSELAAALNGHHRELAQLRLEWAETLDKMTAWANRQAARDRVRIKHSMDTVEANESEPEPAPSPQLPMFPANGHEPPATGRHPKADLYARIQRR